MTTDNDKPPPLAELEAAVHRPSGDVGASRELAKCYCAADNFDLTVELLKRVVRIAPRDAIPHLQDALCLDPDNAADITFDLGAPQTGRPTTRRPPSTSAPNCERGWP